MSKDQRFQAKEQYQQMDKFNIETKNQLIEQKFQKIVPQTMKSNAYIDLEQHLRNLNQYSTNLNLYHQLPQRQGNQNENKQAKQSDTVIHSRKQQMMNDMKTSIHNTQNDYSLELQGKKKEQNNSKQQVRAIKEETQQKQKKKDKIEVDEELQDILKISPKEKNKRNQSFKTLTTKEGNQLDQENFEEALQVTKINAELLELQSQFEKERNEKNLLSSALQQKDAELKEMTNITLQIQTNLEYLKQKQIQKSSKKQKFINLSKDQEAKFNQLNIEKEKLITEKQDLEQQIKELQLDNEKYLQEIKSLKLKNQWTQGDQLLDIQQQNYTQSKSQLPELEQHNIALLKQNNELISILKCKDEYLKKYELEIEYLKKELKNQQFIKICQNCSQMSQLQDMTSKDQILIMNQKDQITFLHQQIDSLQRYIEEMEIQNNKIRKQEKSNDLHLLTERVQNLEKYTSELETLQLKKLQSIDYSSRSEKSVSQHQNIQKEKKQQQTYTTEDQSNKRVFYKREVKQILKQLQVKTLKEALQRIIFLLQIEQSQENSIILRQKLNEMINECSDINFSNSISSNENKDGDCLNNEQI